MEYRGPDPAYSDIDRAKEFATELGEYDQLGEMPQLLLVRGGDLDLKTIWDAAKKSRFWSEIALFNIESAKLRDGVFASQLKRVIVISPWAKPTETEYDPFSAFAP